MLLKSYTQIFTYYLKEKIIKQMIFFYAYRTDPHKYHAK